MANAYIELLKNSVNEDSVYPVTVEDAVLDPSDNQPSIPKLKEEIKTNKEGISQLKEDVNNIKDRTYLRLTNPRSWSQYILPTGFSSTSFPIKIYTNGTNFKYEYDITKFKNKGGKTWYVSPDGSGVGSTKDNPADLKDLLLRVNNALGNNDTIIFLDGIYRTFAEISNAYSIEITKNVNMIAEHTGKVTIANIGVKLTWTKENGVYKTTRSNVVKIAQVINTDIFATSELIKVDSLEKCKNTSGSWYLNNNTTLYVNTLFGKEPSYDNLFVLLNYGIPIIDVQSTKQTIYLYLEGINFIGGTPSTVNFSASASYHYPKLYAKKCNFLHAYDFNLAYDAVSIKGGYAYFDNCKAMYASKDGFNYHKHANGDIPRFIEVNCVGANNGLDGVAGTSNPYQNGSTAHDGVKGLRINGTYYNNNGGNVADVNENTETVNILCSAFDSACHEKSAYNSDFTCQQTGAKMIIENCKAFGSKYSVYCVSGANVVINCSDTESIMIES